VKVGPGRSSVNGWSCGKFKLKIVLSKILAAPKKPIAQLTKQVVHIAENASKTKYFVLHILLHPPLNSLLGAAELQHLSMEKLRIHFVSHCPLHFALSASFSIICFK
jgi:hypothetical protein